MVASGRDNDGASAIVRRRLRERSRGGRAARAFTLIELIVVMAIISLLLSIAVPRYFHGIDRAKEAALKEDLVQMRLAIDQYYSDRGAYPESLHELVDKKYLRSIPKDPVTDSANTWILVPPPQNASGEIYDVRSGAEGNALDGSSFASW